MLRFFQHFRRKFQRKKFAFLTQNKAKLRKILSITLVFGENANFFAENCRKSQKIVIIISTPGHTDSGPKELLEFRQYSLAQLLVDEGVGGVEEGCHGHEAEDDGDGLQHEPGDDEPPFLIREKFQSENDNKYRIPASYALLLLIANVAL
jgi:hypothetical protein